jgi:hypothetical protein
MHSALTADTVMPSDAQAAIATIAKRKDAKAPDVSVDAARAHRVGVGAVNHSSHLSPEPCCS